MPTLFYACQIELIHVSDGKNILLARLIEEILVRFRIICHENVMFVFSYPAYIRYTDEDVIRFFRTCCTKDLDILIKMSVWNEILRRLKTDPDIYHKTEQNRYFDRAVTFANGHYYFKKKNFVDASPEDYCFSYINHKYNTYEQNFKNKTTKRYLDTLSNGDQQIRQLALEIWGYILCNGYMFKNFFLIYGPANTGKSVFCKVAELLVGQSCCSHIPLHDFGRTFQLDGIVGKRLNIDFDLSSKQLSNDAVAKLKSLTTPEAISIEPKNKRSFSYVNEAKILVCANSFPSVSPRDDEAIMERMILLPLMHSVPQNQRNPKLLYKLEKELPYIIHQSLQAFNNVLKNGHFSKVDVAESIKAANTDSVCSFLDERCDQVEGAAVSKHNLYDHYSHFCDSNVLNSSNKQDFFKRLSAMGFREARRMTTNGYLRVISNLKLKKITQDP